MGVLQDGGLRAGEPAGGKILHLPRAAAERNRQCLPAVRRGGVEAEEQQEPGVPPLQSPPAAARTISGTLKRRRERDRAGRE